MKRSFQSNMLRQARTALLNWPRAFGLIWHAARRWTLAWIVLLTAQGILPIATVYLTRTLINRLADMGRGSDPADLPFTLALVVLPAALMLIAQTLRGFSDWVRAAQTELVQDHIINVIHVQAVTLDLSFYDAPTYYDMLHRARGDALHRPVALLENLGALWQNSITLCAMAGVLLSFGVWLPLALTLSTVPALLLTFTCTWREHQWRVRATAAQRRTLYYDWLLTVREAAAELRLFALSAHFRQAYQTLRGKLRGERLQLIRAQAWADLGAGVFGLAIMGGVMGWMVLRTRQAHLTLGDLASVYQAFSQGQNLMRTLLANASQLYANSLFLENLFEFLALTPRVPVATQSALAPAALRDALRFENVLFRYPDATRWSIAEFNLVIPAGQIAAIVGANGAGKSMLIKLLCRFYDPTEGRIILDDVDIRTLPLDDLRSLITVLFQEPVRYHETVAQNIAYGDWRSAPDDIRIQAAAQAAGAAEIIARLPQGYAEVLGKWFGGAELSVGEWQRIALARAFLRQAPIIVLDEPTSAMDSWTEADWMARFRTLAAGRTAIIVTHRFTTAMQADIIHVMDCGRIIESGTHAELTANGGHYAQSWQMQIRHDPILEHA